MKKKSITNAPFEAVLLISFGGPKGRKDIRPFLQNVLRGRRIPEDRLEAVVKHYELFNGISPLTSITMSQADGLRKRLLSYECELPVYVGMRNWYPFLENTLSEMSSAGITRVLGLTLAPHHSYSSCEQYKQNVRRAKMAINSKSKSNISVTYPGGWHTHQGFIDANADHIDIALSKLSPNLRQSTRLIFTAHSIPSSMASKSRYEAELRESAVLITRALGRTDWSLVFQSRSGRPQDPWLEPDICDYLRTEHSRGLESAVISPIGFVADHIEVLYDLDKEASQVCKNLNLPMVRAAAANDHPRFIDTLADVVKETCRLYERGHPLSITSDVSPAHIEQPPPTLTG
jgi:ferrochelatase